MQSWLAQTLLCRPDWHKTHIYTSFCLLSSVPLWSTHFQFFNSIFPLYFMSLVPLALLSLYTLYISTLTNLQHLSPAWFCRKSLKFSLPSVFLLMLFLSLLLSGQTGHCVWDKGVVKAHQSLAGEPAGPSVLLFPF